MAKRHPADHELSAALAMLTEIEAAVAGWLPEATKQLPEAKALGEADLAQAVSRIDAASSEKSPLVHFLRRLDDDIHRIILQASDAEALSLTEKLLLRLRLTRASNDMRRRDGVLAVRVVRLLEGAARLMAALETHRQVMKSDFALIESDLVKRIEQTKSIEDETISDTTEWLATRQEIGEAVIRHEAGCNSLYHKLSIETERGIVVLHALTAAQGVPPAHQLSAEARGVLLPLLTLCEKNMLSMREVERRKHAVDASFLHRFSPVRPAESAVAGQHIP